MSFFSELFSNASYSFKRFGLKEFNTHIKQKDVVLIDVRTANEYKSGHVPKAKNIDVMSIHFSKNMEQFDKNQKIAVYCQGGVRSLKALKKLEKDGYTNICDFKGGYQNWTPSL